MKQESDHSFLLWSVVIVIIGLAAIAYLNRHGFNRHLGVI